MIEENTLSRLSSYLDCITILTFKIKYENFSTSNPQQIVNKSTLLLILASIKFVDHMLYI
jgi:hypothetical protein